MVLDRPGKLTLTFQPADGSPATSHEVFDFPGGGVAMAMYNLDESIRGFARACMNYGLNLGWPVYLSTKNTIMKAYDGRFKDLFEEVFDKEFKRQFDDRRHLSRQLRQPVGRLLNNGYYSRPESGHLCN